MNTMSNTSKVITAAVVVCVVILFVVLYGGHSQAPTQAPSGGTVSSTNGAAGTVPATTTSNPATGTAGGDKSQATGSGSKTTRTTVPPPIIIRLITPVSNDQWQIGITNPISWNNAANFTGEIDLLDGSGNFVGVILSETGTNQTSYGWDTREYSLARYNPLKKEVVPGTYRIRLKFDGNNLPPITSPVITVTN